MTLTSNELIAASRADYLVWESSLAADTSAVPPENISTGEQRAAEPLDSLPKLIDLIMQRMASLPPNERELQKTAQALVDRANSPDGCTVIDAQSVLSGLNIALSTDPAPPVAPAPEAGLEVAPGSWFYTFLPGQRSLREARNTLAVARTSGNQALVASMEAYFKEFGIPLPQ